ncbi:hypothetical protein MMC13_008338 [Lambiella insularis]|nr:hypothetical protein [Lambiella insularis]
MLKITNFKIDPIETPGIVHADNLTEESARETTILLEENNSRYHIFSTIEDDKGVYLHNHIVHQILTTWSLGAKPETIRLHQERNGQYQRQAMVIQSSLVEDMAIPSVFKRCLGREENYRNYERFFLKQINEHGYETVLQRYLVGGDEVADDMLCRIYMGYVHGFIHIDIGLEYKQPLVLAEGLAQAAVHHDMWYTEYLTLAETLAMKAEEQPLPLTALLDMERRDYAIRNSSSIKFHRQTRKHSGRWAMDEEVARDGVLKNSKAELVRLAARYRVSPPGLKQAVAELTNAAVYITAGAQREPHECRFDFFPLHTVTSSIYLTLFEREPSLTNAQKCRLVEYTGRVCMMTYAGMGCPEPNWSWLLSHPSKLPNQTWATVFDRACYHEDDGHLCKMIRVFKHAENISKPYDHLPDFKVKQKMFLPAAIAAIDSSSKQPMEWTKHYDLIRGVGFAECWENIPLRSARVSEKSTPAPFVKKPVTNGEVLEKPTHPLDDRVDIMEKVARHNQALTSVSVEG